MLRCDLPPSPRRDYRTASRFSLVRELFNRPVGESSLYCPPQSKFINSETCRRETIYPSLSLRTYVRTLCTRCFALSHSLCESRRRPPPLSLSSAAVYARRTSIPLPQAVLSRMQLTLHTTRRIRRGASRLLPVMSAWSVKTRRAPSRHCRDARVHVHATTALHDDDFTPHAPSRKGCLVNGQMTKASNK